MSKYQSRLIKHINDNPTFIQPEHRRNEVLGFLRSPLEDLCISRPKARLNWGIEIPFDKKYVTYVWFDALINYVSAIGYQSDEKKYNTFWPVNFHLIGKDILTTHSVYWPTMLMSAELPLPKGIFAHGWWLSDQTKMSKSLGNVVDPIDLIDSYGVDPIRFYLMKEMVLGQDANFSMDSFIKCYNSDLANDFGNLLSRVTNLINKFYDGALEPIFDDSIDGQDVKYAALDSMELSKNFMNDMKINEAINSIFNFVRKVNKYLEITAPWKLVKTDIKKAGKVLYTAAESIRIISLLLSPVMPNRTESVMNALGTINRDLEWGKLVFEKKIQKQDPLFPRIEYK